MSCIEEGGCISICVTPELYDTWHKGYIQKNIDNKLEPP